MVNKMEKLQLKNKPLNDKVLSSIIDEILSNDVANKFINEHDLTLSDVKNNFVNFLSFIEDYEVCKKCNGLEKCVKSAKGMASFLQLDMYGTVSCHVTTCDLMTKYLRIKNNYRRQDFEEQFLYNRINKENDIIPYRERYEVYNYLGKMKSKVAQKGLFLYGNKGVGKSYLTICWCNDLVENNFTVSYIDVKRFCDEMRGLVKEGNEVVDSYLDKIKKSDVVVLDDLGNEKITTWSRDNILYDILDYRSRNHHHMNVIISNYSYDDLKKLYNIDNELRAKRFIELIKSCGEAIELKGLSRR